MKIILFLALFLSGTLVHALSYDDRLKIDGFDGDEETQRLERGDLKFLEKVRVSDQTLLRLVRAQKLTLRNELSSVDCNKSDRLESRCTLQIYVMTQRVRDPVLCSQRLRWHRVGSKGVGWQPSDEPTRAFTDDPAGYIKSTRLNQYDCDNRRSTR